MVLYFQRKGWFIASDENALTNFERNYYMLINNFFLLLSDGSRIWLPSPQC